MKRTELSKLLGNRGSLGHRITEPNADYTVYDVGLSDSAGSNAVLFEIPPGVSTELEEIVRPINLKILTLHGIGRVLLHSRVIGNVRQQRLAVAEKPIAIVQGDIYSYQSCTDLVLLDTCTPPFQEGDEMEPDLTTLPDTLIAALRGR